MFGTLLVQHNVIYILCCLIDCIACQGAERLLRGSAFFGEQAEVPLALPAPRSVSPSSLQRSREEAQAVERRFTRPPAPSDALFWLLESRGPRPCDSSSPAGSLKSWPRLRWARVQRAVP